MATITFPPEEQKLQCAITRYSQHFGHTVPSSMLIFHRDQIIPMVVEALEKSEPVSWWKEMGKIRRNGTNLAHE